MHTIAAATPHPYREQPVARPPLVRGGARRLAAHGVSIVLVCLVCRWLAFLSHEVLFAPEVFLVVGTWLFTLRCDADNRAARVLGWLLRILATVDGVIAIARVPRFSWLEQLDVVLALAVVPALALTFLAARLHSFGLPQQARQLVKLIVACIGSTLLAIVGITISEYLTLLFVLPAFTLHLMLGVWGFALMIGMRRMLWVDAHEWWLDLGALPSVEWTSYARTRDGRVEVVGHGGRRSWFDNHSDAIHWLDTSGFRPFTEGRNRDETTNARSLLEPRP